MNSAPFGSLENLPLWRRFAPLAVWVVSALLGLLIPLQILQLGYRPGDDALRHVGKALSGRSWTEILVVQDGYGGDEHPGWHALLGAAHRAFDLDADALVALSVAVPFALYWLAMLAWRKRPEALLAALLLASVAAPDSFMRLLLGRPFVVVLIVTVTVLQLWARPQRGSLAQIGASIALIGASVWVHGSWYLFGIVVAAFALCGEWRKTGSLAACWLAGTLLGAALTGHPIDYLRQTTTHLFDVFGSHTLDRMLVTELRADYGELTFVTGIGLALVWRVARGEWKREAIFNPVFALAALGWLLGLQVSRFWSDWGYPAAILWLAVELEQVLEARLSREKVSAALLAAFVAAGVYIGATRDLSGRWTRNLDAVFLSPGDPKLPRIAKWMPAPGGIVYSASLDVFFRTFYRNPQADWRYLLGFEVGIMPREDRQILRDIQRSGYAPEAYAPWVKRMRAPDRMILLQAWKPDIPELEWYYAGGNTWIGRLRGQEIQGSSGGIPAK
ncbi:MAG TPA: hypothetical protein VII72_09990 [Myxococcota bacterium]|jgi:hypothetical protein